MSLSAVAFGLAMALPQSMDFNHPAAPWAVLTNAGAGPGGSDSTRVVISRQTTLGADGKVLAYPAAIWIVRKEIKQTWTMPPRAGQTQESVQWADSRTCPRLTEVLDSLDRLPMARPYPMRQITKPFIDPPPSHSGGWSLQRWGAVNGSEVGINLTDTSGAILWPWWRKASEVLKSCWSDQAPSYP
jgi:hypothetical protein